MFTTIVLGLVSVIGVNTLTQWYKNLQDKYTKTEINIVAFLLCFIFTGGYALVTANPNWMTMLEHLGLLFTSSISAYTVLWSEIGKIINVNGSNSTTVS